MPPEHGEERTRWSKKSSEANPHVFPTSELNRDFHFLGECSHFPSKHWLEIPAAERTAISRQLRPERFQWGHDAFHMEKRPLLIMSVEDCLRSPLSLLDKAFVTIKAPEHSGDFIFSWCWPRSERKLLEDFRKWLEDNRPPDQPPLHKTAESTSRKTSHRDLLKALGALRLLKAFENDVREASYHAWEVLDKPLYKDQPAWIKARKRAEQEIAVFESKALRR